MVSSMEKRGRRENVLHTLNKKEGERSGKCDCKKANILIKKFTKYGGKTEQGRHWGSADSSLYNCMNMNMIKNYYTHKHPHKYTDSLPLSV